MLIIFRCAFCDKKIKGAPHEKAKVIERDNWVRGPNAYNRKDLFLVCVSCYNKNRETIKRDLTTEIPESLINT